MTLPDTPAKTSKKPPRRRWLRRTLSALALLLLLCAALIGWLLASESGLQVLLSTAQRYAPQLTITNARGSLAGGLAIERLQYRLPEREVDLENLVFDWNAGALLRLHVDIQRLYAERITLTGSGQPAAETPARDERRTPPPLRLPLSIAIGELGFGALRLQASGSDEMRLLAEQFSTALQSDGSRHELLSSRIQLPSISGQAKLAGQIETASTPYQAQFTASLSGQLQHQERSHNFNTRLQGEGALDALAIRFDLDEDTQPNAARARLQATLNAFAAMPLQSARLELKAFNPNHYLPQAPQAKLTANVALQQTSVDPTLAPWQLAGKLTLDNHAALALDQQGLPLETLHSELLLQPERVVLKALDIRLPEQGRLDGEIEFANQRLQARLTAHNIHPHAFDSALPDAAVSGSLNASGDQHRQSGALELKVGDARLQAEGEFHAARADQTAARFAVHGSLHEIDPSLFHRAAPDARLNTRFAANGTLSEKAQIEANWQFLPSTLNGHKLNGKGEIRLDGKRLADSDIDLTLGGNQLRLQGNWSADSNAAGDLRLDLDAPRLAAFDLAASGLDGSAKLNARLRGSAQKPQLDLQVDANALALAAWQLDKLSASGQLHWRADQTDAPLKLKLNASGLQQKQDSAAAASTLLAEAALDLDGSLNAHRLRLTARQSDQQHAKLELSGGLREREVTPRWQGQLQRLQIDSAFANAELQSAAPLKLAADAFDLGAALIKIGEAGELKLQRTRWQADGRIEAKGSLHQLRPVALLHKAQAGDDSAESIFATVPAAATGDPLQLGGEWDLRLDRKASGALRLYRESGDLILPGSDQALGIEQLEARLQTKGQALALTLDLQGKTFGSLQAQARTPLKRKPDGGWQLDGNSALKANLTLDTPDLAWLARLVPEQILDLGGQLKAQLAVDGTLAAPQLNGQISAEALAFDLPEQGLKLSGGSLQARFDRDRIQIERLHFESPNSVRPNAAEVPVDVFTQTPGELSAQGEIALGDGSGRFQFEAQRLPLLQRGDRWLILSGKGSADSGDKRFKIDARFVVDSGYFELADTPAPSLSEDVVTTDEIERAAQQQAQAADDSSQIRANIEIDLGNELHLSALGLKTRLGGSLNLRQHGKQPLVAIGTLSTRGGVYRGYGQDLTIERGLINFQGALDNPGLNILAMRTGLAVEAGVEVLGSVRRPLIKLVSRPQVADIEKLSWIVLGRAPRGGAGDSALLASAAQNIFGGSSSEGGITDQFKEGLGLDEFGIGSGEMGSARRAQTSRVVADGSVVTDSGDNSMQALTIGKRLSDKLTFSFEQSLGGAQTLAKLSYQVSRRLSLVLRGGENNSADLYYTLSFR